MGEWLKRVKAVSLGCAIAICLVLLFELVFWLLNKSYSSNSTNSPRLGAPASHAKNYLVPTGFRKRSIVNETPIASSVVEKRLWYQDGYCCLEKNGAPIPQYGDHASRAVSAADGRVIYETTYHVDLHHYRVSPQHSKEPTRFAIFLGCSFVYGEGLSDVETLSAQFERRSPGTRSYNFGYHAYAPNDLLARARAEKTQELVPEKDGVIVYNFLDHHVLRVIGAASWIGDYGWNHPYFRLAGNGIEQKGNFRESRPWYWALAYLVSHSQTMRFFGVDLPFRLEGRHFELFGRVVEALRDEYRAKFPSAKFVVMLYPPLYPAPISERVAEQLEKRGIHYLDYSRVHLGKFSRGPSVIPGDGHPSAEANEVLADQLAKDLKEFESKARIGAR